MVEDLLSIDKIGGGANVIKSYSLLESLEMPVTLKVVLFLNIVLYFLPAIRFYKSKYFWFFLSLSLLDPVYIALYYAFGLSTYYYLPVAFAVPLLFIPSNNKKHIIISFLLTIMFLPYFRVLPILPVLVTAISATYIIYFFIEELICELKNSSMIVLFIPVIVFDLLKDFFKIYLYYEYNGILTQYYTAFLIAGLIFPAAITYFGATRKYKSALLSKIFSSKSFGIVVPSSLHIVDFTVSNQLKDLTNAEKRVLALVAEGYKNDEIAKKLFVTKRTIYLHCQNIKNKLNISSSSRLARFAFENRDYLPKSTQPSHIDSMHK